MNEVMKARRRRVRKAAALILAVLFLACGALYFRASHRNTGFRELVLAKEREFGIAVQDPTKRKPLPPSSKKVPMETHSLKRSLPLSGLVNLNFYWAVGGLNCYSHYGPDGDRRFPVEWVEGYPIHRVPGSSWAKFIEFADSFDESTILRTAEEMMEAHAWFEENEIIFDLRVLSDLQWITMVLFFRGESDRGMELHRSVLDYFENGRRDSDLYFSPRHLISWFPVAAADERVPAEYIEATLEAVGRMHHTDVELRESSFRAVLRAHEANLALISKPPGKGNAWSYFLDGVPEKTLNAFIRPMVEKDLEEVAIAWIEGDAKAIERAEAQFRSWLPWMNTRTDLLYLFGSPKLQDAESPQFPRQVNDPLYLQEMDICGTELLARVYLHRKEKGSFPRRLEDISNVELREPRLKFELAYRTGVRPEDSGRIPAELMPVLFCKTDRLCYSFPTHIYGWNIINLHQEDTAVVADEFHFTYRTPALSLVARELTERIAKAEP